VVGVDFEVSSEEKGSPTIKGMHEHNSIQHQSNGHDLCSCIRFYKTEYIPTELVCDNENHCRRKDSHKNAIQSP